MGTWREMRDQKCRDMEKVGATKETNSESGVEDGTPEKWGPHEYAEHESGGKREPGGDKREPGGDKDD